ncbi:MAG: cobalamin biosynthesis protein [Chloroflexota bacterium]|nr:cobalamin biosynthesis protein [Chloroflexota bacterium]
MDMLLVLLLALVIDLVFGDPPTIIHPVGWMGKLISLMKRFAPKSSQGARFNFGIAMVLIGVAVFVIPVYFFLAYLEGLNRIAWIIVGALILKSTFSITGLRCSALQIRNLLSADDLKGAQARMNSLVSRDASGLDESMIVAATVESVAENTSDGIVAPLFYFLILGVPGAVAYRMVNTFDSMIGYYGKYEHLGKFAARFDDVLNFIPARITGFLIVFAALLGHKNVTAAWHTIIRDHGDTQSPNAGWPMAAAAGALDVQLEKAGHYKLGEANSKLTFQKIDSILLLMHLASLLWIVICFITKGVQFVLAT